MGVLKSFLTIPGTTPLLCALFRHTLYLVHHPLFLLFQVHFFILSTSTFCTEKLEYSELLLQGLNEVDPKLTCVVNNHAGAKLSVCINLFYSQIEEPATFNFNTWCEKCI